MVIVWSDLGMMFSQVMLSEVVHKISFSPLPMSSEMILHNLIYNPKVLHFHGSRVLFLDSVICESSGSGIIARNWWGWLGVAHFVKNSLFGIDKDRTKREQRENKEKTKREQRRRNKSLEGCDKVYRSIQFYWLLVLGWPSRKEASCSVAFYFGCTKA